MVQCRPSGRRLFVLPRACNAVIWQVLTGPRSQTRHRSRAVRPLRPHLQPKLRHSMPSNLCSASPFARSPIERSMLNIQYNTEINMKKQIVAINFWNLCEVAFPLLRQALTESGENYVGLNSEVPQVMPLQPIDFRPGRPGLGEVHGKGMA